MKLGVELVVREGRHAGSVESHGEDLRAPWYSGAVGWPTARGREVYRSVCATCHGEPHTGNGRLGPLVSIIPEASIEFAEEQGVAPALVVIEKVRHGQFFGIGGNMPLFTREALSDEDLAAILAYLEL